MKHKKSFHRFIYLLLLIMSLCVASCSEDDSDKPGDTENLTIASTTQCVVTIDGKKHHLSDGLGNGMHTSSAPTDKGETGVVLSAFAGLTSELDPRLSIHKGTIKHKLMGYISDEAFENFFKTGPYEYSPKAVNGIEITWIDDNNQMWSTSYGSAEQQYSSFSVDETKLLTRALMKVKINFSCTLYNEAGEFITVNDGVFIGVFYNYEAEDEFNNYF